METLAHHHSYASQRSVAMALALVTAIVLSPLYLAGGRNRDERNWYYYETRWNPISSGFVLPAIVAGLVIAIRTASSSSSPSPSSSSAADPAWLLRIGSSPWGLAGVLVMLLVVIMWQDSVQEFFWK